MKLEEQEVTTHRATAGKTSHLPKRFLPPLLLGQITRSLRRISRLKGTAYVVGGLVTEGASLRDIDIVVTNPADIKKIKKALGKYASRAHFIVQKEEPPAPLFLKITGRETKSPDLTKKKPLPRYEYAGP